MVTTKSETTQNFIPIKEVRDGVIILKDESMRALLMTSSLNFALKSEDEQSSIIFQFQNFLNSLDFSIQIFIESRRLDIRPYLALLENRQKEQTNDLLKIQIKEYIEFIKTFTENSNIMTKVFFIVVPYTPPRLSLAKTQKKMNKKNSAKEKMVEDFEEDRIQLEQRVAVVEQGIVRTGIRAVRLGTEEIIEVYYRLFNPGEMEKPISLNEN
jgi:hypothetical protein